jgi:hypothetical protein
MYHATPVCGISLPLSSTARAFGCGYEKSDGETNTPLGDAGQPGSSAGGGTNSGGTSDAGRTNGAGSGGQSTLNDAGADASSTPSPSDDASTSTNAPDAAPIDAGPSRIAFVTSTVQNGALGGLDGADDLCNSLAVLALLPGTYKAWLSTAATSAEDRLEHSVIPYARVDGVKVADDWDDLIDGVLEAAIRVDENGVLVSGDVWTGTRVDATTYAADATQDCEAFTSGIATPRARCGASTATNGTWTESSFPLCSTLLRLYCIEQGE